MKKIRCITAFLLILVVGFGAGLAVAPNNEVDTAVVLNGFGSKSFEILPEEEDVTIDQVKQKLEELGQLAAYSGTYTVEKTMDFSRCIFDNIQIPGSVNTVSFLCEGVVKVVYDVNEIVPAIDNLNREIRIQLPMATVLDHYMIWGNLENQADAYLSSPIAFAEYQELMLDAEGDILAQAEIECIFEKAEDSIQTAIRNYLSGFDGYKVVFA